MSTEVIEVFWNAKPHLARLSLKVSGAALDPRAERLFAEVRAAAQQAFPDAVVLVRIATRSGDPQADLRAARGGEDLADHRLETLRALIEQAVARAAPPAPEPVVETADAR